jgi:CBS domain-containing protein
VPGKVDWFARALPMEGQGTDVPRILPLANDDVVTCGLDRPIGEVIDEVRESPYGFALVKAAEGTLLGRLRMSNMKEADPSTRAEDVMDPGPSTVRPDLPVDELRKRLDDKELKTAIVSTPEGKLIGVVKRSQLD